MSNCYIVGRDDVILSVSDGWSSFAAENGAPQLTRDSVLDSSLWDFVVGAETRYLYRTIFSAVRDRRSPAVVPFRCDAPDRRRFMQLTIRPMPEASLELTAETVREESRPRMAMLDPAAGRSEELIKMCGWCKRVLLDGPVWAEVEEAVAHLGLFDSALLPEITQGICPECIALAQRASRQAVTPSGPPSVRRRSGAA